MTASRPAPIRRFRFNPPQRVAALLLGLFLAQSLWLAVRQPVTGDEFQYALCGQQMWQRSARLDPGVRLGVRNGVLVFRIAGLPLALASLAQNGLRHFHRDEDRDPPDAASSPASPSDLREVNGQVALRLLLRLPFLFVGLLLGGGLWWVARRLYGNLGGYMALALYCFSPPMLRASSQPGTGMLAALAVYGGVYTCIGVAHAMQGPRRKWRPRILLLSAIFALAVTSHWAALALAALLGTALMLWVAEGRRKQILPIVLLALGGAMVCAWVCCGFSLQTMGLLFTTPARFSWDAAFQFFSTPASTASALAAAAALLLYLAMPRARYFGNTAPLLCALALLPLQLSAVPGIWATPFLLTFVGGVFADAFEKPRGRWMQAAAGALVLLQAVFCLRSLSGPI
jgi:hypothetical protein